MSESISVVYEPLGSIAGVTFYHETLVYTNSAGDQSIATSFATQDPTGNALGNVSQAIGAASTGGTSVYGTLGNVSGNVNDPHVQDTVNVGNLLNSSNPREVVATGDDLSSKWQTIVNTENQLSQESLAYSPITQNSNSEAGTALRAADIAPPSDNGLFSAHWAPAAGNVLPTPVTSASTDSADQNQAIDQLDEAEADDEFDYNVEADGDISGNGDPVDGGGTGGGDGGYGGGGGGDGGGGDGGGGGYYGYYGLAARADKVKAALGRDVGAIARHDLAAGDHAGAAAAQAGHLQARREATLHASSGDVRSPVLEAAQWDQRVITWSVAANDGAGTLDGAQQATARSAFAAWARSTGIDFEQVRSGGDISVGFGDLDTADSGAVGFTTLKASGGTIETARIELEDPSRTALVGSHAATATYAGTDAQFQQVLEHEIGHAIGLADDADSHSVMFYELTAANRNLDQTDLAGAALLAGHGGAASADTGVAQLTQALGSFGAVASTGGASNHETWRPTEQARVQFA